MMFLAQRDPLVAPGKGWALGSRHGFAFHQVFCVLKEGMDFWAKTRVLDPSGL